MPFSAWLCFFFLFGKIIVDTSLFDYQLPSDAIAQEPSAAREQSRLLRLDRKTGGTEDHRFIELPQLLRSGDLLVLNDTRVLPARLALRRETGSRIEALYVRSVEDGRMELLLRGRGRIREDERLQVEGAEGQTLRLLARRGEGLWLVAPEPPVTAEVLLARAGRPPLPPYIERRQTGPDQDQIDAQRYQTVYAAKPGAIAAPTAGLHFTPQLLDDLRRHEIEIACLTLHVGLGTFKPVTVERIEDHEMHAERFHVPAATAAAVMRAKAEGRRVVAVGTTTVRVLESLVRLEGLGDISGETSIFIYPPFQFRVVDALITNFHLPRSTLLMLVSAFAGRELLLRVYHDALARGYRFYSYGDACLIE
jgi:S-adenosylmethionine:tRNA ribosyltransferase-isomerase